MEELREAKNLEYKTKLMAFVNCLIISAGSGKERIAVRNEFIGLKILDILAALRRDKPVGELATQIDLFEEQRKSDENMESLDVNSHQDIFFTILRQISGHSQFETPFLHILQHLLTIEYNNRLSGGDDLPAIIWDTAETLVHRATTLIESRDDADKLLRLHQKRRGSCDMTVANGWPTLNSPSSNLSSPTSPPKPFPRSSSRPLSPAVTNEAKFEPIHG